MDEMFPLSSSFDLATRRVAVQSQEDLDDAASIDSDFSMSVERAEGSSVVSIERSQVHDEGMHDAESPRHSQVSDEDIPDEQSVLFSLEQQNTDVDEQYSNSMSLELRYSQEDDNEDDPAAAPASSSAAAAAAASSSSSLQRSASPAAAASSFSLQSSSRRNSDERLLEWYQELNGGPFIPPPPLETPEQIEARRRAEQKAHVAKLAHLAEQSAVQARQQQMRQIGAQQRLREQHQGHLPDTANQGRRQGRMTENTMHDLIAKYESNQLDTPFLMQPAVYTKARKFRLTGRNPQRLIWSIKLDGNRALWDGWKQLLISKTSRIEIKPPSFWRDLMPRNCYLDGELFVPSDERVNGTNTEFAGELYEVAPVWRIRPESINRQASSIHDNKWLRFEFHAFDIVGSKLNGVRLEIRLAVLEATLREFESRHPNEKPVFRRVFYARLAGNNEKEVHASVDDLLLKYGKGLGAEGIVIKDLDSTYHCRSPNPVVGWLKAKYYEDVEAMVQVDNHVTRNGERAVIILLPYEQRITQVVTYANSNLISDRKLKNGMIVSVAFMPDPKAPDNKHLRTPIIRSIVEVETAWEDVLQRQREKDEEVRLNS